MKHLAACLGNKLLVRRWPCPQFCMHMGCSRYCLS
jgi:hypothetical protein